MVRRVVADGLLAVVRETSCEFLCRTCTALVLMLLHSIEEVLLVY
jgi:hypothetical protein